MSIVACNLLVIVDSLLIVDIFVADVGEGGVSAGVPRPHCLPVDGTCLGGDHSVPRTTEDLTAGQQ